MQFEIVANPKVLKVSLEQDAGDAGDAGDADIVVCDSHGEKHTIAYQNSDGLTICARIVSLDIDVDANGVISYSIEL